MDGSGWDPDKAEDVDWEGRPVMRGAPKSEPVSSSDSLPRSKFTDRAPLRPEEVLFGTDATGFRQERQCGVDVELVWTNKLDSGIYATPVIEELLRDGTRQIVVPGFKRSLDMLDGDGHRMPEWPFNMDDVYFHASPLVADLDHTGIMDIIWVSVNGEVFIVSGDPLTGGMLKEDPIYMPKLKVKKRWYEGLRYDEDLKMGASTASDPNLPDDEEPWLDDPLRDSFGQQQQQQQPHSQQQDPSSTPTATPTPTPLPHDTAAAEHDPATHGVMRDPVPNMPDMPDMPNMPGMHNIPRGYKGPQTAPSSHPPPRRQQNQRRRLLSLNDAFVNEEDQALWNDDDYYKNILAELSAEGAVPLWHNDDDNTNTAGAANGLTDEDLLKLDAELFWKGEGAGEGEGEGERFLNGLDGEEGQYDWMKDVGDGMTPEGRDSLNLFMDDEDPYSTFGNVDHLDDQGNLMDDAQFGNEPWNFAGTNSGENRFDEFDMGGDDYIFVDAHIMATPVLVDVDKDGDPELIVSVSYFFDEDDYNNNPRAFAHLPPDVDIKKYVAGGIVCYKIKERRVMWSEHLDLTTDETKLRAFIYGSPTVIDLDGDGELEVIVGTSLGFIYALNAMDGKVLEGYPLVMSEIQGQVAVADVNHDGKLEIIAVDSKGNVLCFDKAGKEIWETRITGFSAQNPTIGDVDGDGQLDVVVGTVKGHIWALRGDSGKPLDNFPVKTNGKILSPVLLVNLDTSFVRRPGLHLVAPSFDGNVYIVDGRTGCTQKIDIGEKAYAMVLTDDILGNDKMDLLVATMTGNTYLFGTESPYHPLKVWREHSNKLNGFSVKEGYHGIYIDTESRKFRDVLGSTVTLDVVIVDNRPVVDKSDRRRYFVTYFEDGLEVLREVYTEPGLYSVTIPCPQVPRHSTIRVEMYNEHRQFFYDTVSLGFNIHFYRMLKWMLVLPFLAMSWILLFVRSKKAALPV